MEIATENDAQFRKELLDKLLCKKVTYQDVKRHGLSQREMDYLRLYDILDRREYVRLVMREGYSKQTAYNKWKRVVKELIKDFDPKPHANLITLLKKNGGDPSVLEMWLSARCKGGIPAKDILTVRDYIVDFLGRVRDALYTDTLTTCETARKLGKSPRHIQRLVKEGSLLKCGRGRFSENQVTGYKNRKRRHFEQDGIRKSKSCTGIVKKLIENEIELAGDLRNSFEMLRFFMDILFEPPLDRKRHREQNVAFESIFDRNAT